MAIASTDACWRRLVCAGLAAAKREVVLAGGKAIEVVGIRITAAGRRAIEG
jgi:hypothetical protein